MFQKWSLASNYIYGVVFCRRVGQLCSYFLHSLWTFLKARLTQFSTAVSFRVMCSCNYLVCHLVRPLRPLSVLRVSVAPMLKARLISHFSFTITLSVYLCKQKKHPICHWVNVLCESVIFIHFMIISNVVFTNLGWLQTDMLFTALLHYRSNLVLFKQAVDNWWGKVWWINISLLMFYSRRILLLA